MCGSALMMDTLVPLGALAEIAEPVEVFVCDHGVVVGHQRVALPRGLLFCEQAPVKRKLMLCLRSTVALSWFASIFAGFARILYDVLI